VRMPVQGAAPGEMDVVARLQLDPADERLVRFSYTFTAPAAVKLNCARLTFRLPIEPYAGQSVTTVAGPAMTPDKLPRDPLQGGHLLNATAGGAAIAEDQPHGLRVDLDSPKWCILDDSRRWTGAVEYSLQLCALVAADGTTLAAGQSANVSGTVRFGSKVHVQAADSTQTPALSFARPRVDLTNLWFPRLIDATGLTLLSVDLIQLGLPEGMHPEPQGEAERDPRTGGFKATARLYANAKRETYLEIVRTVTRLPDSLRISDQLTARGRVESFGVLAWVSVAPQIVEEGRHTAVFVNEAAHSIPISPSSSGAKPVWETALGLRLQTPDGQTAIELTGDLPRTWGAWPGPRGGWLQQRVAEPGVDQITTTRPDGTVTVQTRANVFADASTASHTLTIKWNK
jgi:hypothetical protein